MSYCRWSTPIPELTPDVDLSIEKIMKLMMRGYEAYEKYKNDNGIITSDAYVYESVYGGFVCDWKMDGTAGFDTALEMAEYLTQEKAKGAHIPQNAIDALLEEHEWRLNSERRLEDGH